MTNGGPSTRSIVPACQVTEHPSNLNIVNFDQRKYHKVYLILNPAVQIKEMEMASHKVDSLGRLKSWEDMTFIKMMTIKHKLIFGKVYKWLTKFCRLFVYLCNFCMLFRKKSIQKLGNHLYNLPK